MLNEYNLEKFITSLFLIRSEDLASAGQTTRISCIKPQLIGSAQHIAAFIRRQ